MKLYLDEHTFIDTSQPLDLSIPLSATAKNPRAWHVNPPEMEPVRTERYTGSIQEGGVVNFRNVFFNPHGHGTHTECLGHITQKVHEVNKVLKEYFFEARLVSVLPSRIEKDGEVDFVIFPDQLPLDDFKGKALIVRTLPNDGSKRIKNYSSTNPPYFSVDCVPKLIEAGIDHLLTDLPSVDRESDRGVLAFHHAFWEVPENPNFRRTITEFIFADHRISDGDYLLNIQMAAFANDAAPSRPVIYKKQKRVKII